MPQMSGSELLAAVRSHAPAVGVVVTTAFSGDEEVQRVSADSSIRFLPKPYSLEQLVEVVEQLLAINRPRPGFSGSIAVPQLPDLIQIQSLARASQKLTIEHAGRVGRLWFSQGQVVDADCGTLRGPEAFFALLRWPAGTFRVSPIDRSGPPPPTIHASTIELLMEGLRLLDEGAAAATSPFEELEDETLFQSDVERSTQPDHQGDTVGNVKEMLNKMLEIDGAIAVALVDHRSGMALGTAGSGLNLDVAAAGNTEVVRQKLKVMAALGLKDHIEDILITLGSQYHLIRIMASRPTLFIYLALVREKANLAMARHKLAELEGKIEI
jgi:Domain of unknown function (DUF4388)